eukprot:Sro1078_g238730.2  (91) ;mRNA; r:11434-11706
MKFQGTAPSWDELDRALQVAESKGYMARAKHFFNNKNEVTLMLQQQQHKVDKRTTLSSPAADASADTSTGSGIPSFYKPAFERYLNTVKD